MKLLIKQFSEFCAPFRNLTFWQILILLPFSTIGIITFLFVLIDWLIVPRLLGESIFLGEEALSPHYSELLEPMLTICMLFLTGTMAYYAYKSFIATRIQSNEIWIAKLSKLREDTRKKLRDCFKDEFEKDEERAFSFGIISKIESILLEYEMEFPLHPEMGAPLRKLKKRLEEYEANFERVDKEFKEAKKGLKFVYHKRGLPTKVAFYFVCHGDWEQEMSDASMRILKKL